MKGSFMREREREDHNPINPLNVEEYNMKYVCHPMSSHHDLLFMVSISSMIYTFTYVFNLSIPGYIYLLVIHPLSIHHSIAHMSLYISSFTPLFQLMGGGNNNMGPRYCHHISTPFATVIGVAH